MTAYHVYAFRLLPGQDLKKEIERQLAEKQVKAGWVNTCVGSLTQYQLRFANQLQAHSETGYFEILSLSGTLSMHGCHLHICISDSSGQTLGGHLMYGNLIYTTAEVVITTSDDLVFTREADIATGCKELHINKLR